MIDINDLTKSKLEQFNISKIVKITLDNLDITEDLISQSSVSLTQALSSKDNYSVGNVICGEFDFSIINTADKYKESSFYNKNITVELDVDGDIIPCGQYICQRPTISNSGKIDIVSYDKIIKTEVNSDKFLNSLTYPIKLIDFIRQACEYCNIEHNISDDITNAEFLIQDRPDSQKLTIRELLSMALSIAGGNGRINTINNKFEVVYLENTGYTIPDSVHFSNVSIEDYNTVKIDFISISNSDNTEVYYGNKEGSGYYLDSNDLVFGSTDEQLVNMLGNLYQQIKDLTYKPYKLDIKRGLIFLQPGDIISFVYRDVTYTAPILELKFDGIWQSMSIEGKGTEDRDSIRSDSVSSSMTSSVAKSAASSSKYTLTSTKRYLSSNGQTIVAIGMYHKSVNKELIFKPDMSDGDYLGMLTNFQDEIVNTDLFGEDPDMTMIN